MNYKKLNTIILIDDNEADNYIHSSVLEEMNIAEKIIALDAGDRALEFLEKKGNEKIDLIFLDINMPRMNGFEFYEEYQKLDLTNKDTVIVVMLTTSIADDDITKAEQLRVNAYLSKPLTSEAVMDIMDKHFQEQ